MTPTSSSPPVGGPYRRWGKRLFDLVLTVPAVAALAPVMALIALAVRLDSPGPALFRQSRAGRGGKPFELLKFRTMTDRKRDVHHEVHSGHPEVTRVGGFLRRSKLDELPQLWHVVSGKMSLVGPRPDLPEHLAGYDAYGRKRLLVPPGCTGLAQVRGSIHLTWPERWRWDARYVDRLSLATDLGILARTVGVLLFGEKRYLERPDSEP